MSSIELTDVDAPPPDPKSLADAFEAVDHAVAQARAGEIAKIMAIAAACDLYQVDRTVLIAGCEEVYDGGSDGAPKIGEFLAGELGPRLRMSTINAAAQIAFVLNLRHRHRCLWHAVVSGDVDPWQARIVTEKARDLTAEAVGRIDEAITLALMQNTLGRALRQIGRLILSADPVLAQRKASEAAAFRDVRVSEITNDHVDIWGRLSAADGLALDAVLTRLSTLLPGDDSDRFVGQRRARGLALLVQHALDPENPAYQLPAGLADPSTSTSTSSGSNASSVGRDGGGVGGRGSHGGCTGCCGQAGGHGSATGELGGNDSEPAGGSGGRRGTRAKRVVELVVHLTGHADPTTGDITLDPTAQVDRFGDVLTTQLSPILAGCHIKVHPILDLAQAQPVTGYRTPPWLRRALEARMPYSMAPFDMTPARNCDMDHTIPYDFALGAEQHGIPGAGQTRVGNLAPLGQRWHRIKTHGGWRMEQIEPGIVEWLSPLGYMYTVTPHGTYAHPYRCLITS